MRILFANYRYFVSSGSERYMLNATSALEARGHEIIPFAVRYARNLPTPYDRYFVPPLGAADEVYFRDHKRDPGAALRTLRRLFYAGDVEKAAGLLARDTRPHVAYVLNYLRKLSPALLVGLHAAGVPIVVRLSDYGMVCPQGHCVRDGVPCVLCTHGNLGPSVRYRCVQGSLAASGLNALATWVHQRRGYFDLVSAFVVPSPFMHRFLAAAGFAPGRLHLVPSFVDATRFKPPADGHRDGYIAYAGRLDPPKGLEVLIDAVAILAAAQPRLPVELRIAGAGSAVYRAALERRVASAGVQDRVRFVGELSTADLVGFLSRAQLSVMPSLWFENLPNAVLESLACGTPVVASNIGSLADCITDGRTGALFEPGDAASLATRLQALLVDAPARARLSQSARAAAEREYAPAAHVEKLEGLFATLARPSGVTEPVPRTVASDARAHLRQRELRVAYLGSKGLGSVGGVERVVAGLAAHGAADGIRPTVYGHRRRRPVDVPGVCSIRLPALPGKHLRPVSLALISALHAVVCGRYDVIHLHNAEASFVLPLLRLRYPVVATSHGFAYRRSRWGRIARFCMRCMDRPFATLSTIATCVSESAAAEMQASYGRRVEYVPNGIDIPVANKDPAADAILAAHGLVPNEYAMFASIVLDATKGASTAIAACNLATMPLLIVGGHGGGGSDERALLQAAGTQVVFHPRIDAPPTLFALLKDAACLVFPSTLEAMSMLLLECAALGTPIVCSGISENRSVLAGNALYFAPSDTATLARHLEWIRANQHEAATMAQRARDHVRHRYSSNEVAARYAALYREAFDAR